MKTLIKTFTAAVLIVGSTWAMAAENLEKGTNLSTADFAINHYVEVMTEGQSLGLEQLFTSDYSQKVHGKNPKTTSRSEVISFLKNQKGYQLIL